MGTDAYRKAAYVAEKYNAEPYWMAIQLDENEYNIYFGSLSELEGKEQIPLKKCGSGDCGQILVKDKRHYFDYSYLTNLK